MVSVTFDKSTVAQLGDVNRSAEIRDVDGQLLGYFTPVTEVDAEMYRFARDSIDPQELARRKNVPGPRLTRAEVRRHLESLEPTECDSQ